MKNVTWNLYEMAFIQFVLLEARQLEVFGIHESRRCLKPNQAALALAEVAHYMRSSPAANLVISQMPYR
jgi:hypothetical protein